MYDAIPFRFFLIPKEKESALEDLFRVLSFNGEEYISRPYLYHLTLVSTSPFIKPKDMIGKSASLQINDSNGAKEHIINGMIFKFEQAGTGNRFTTYHITLAPRLGLLKFGQNCRIFQSQTIAQIIHNVFKDAGLFKDADYDIQLDDREPRKYCVQYRESDFDFISRLMEDEGICYYFKHTETRHLMVIRSHTASQPRISKTSNFEYHNIGNPEETDGMITNIVGAEQLVTNKVTLQDYHFEEPPLAPLKVEAQAKPSQEFDFEHYDYPGLYQQTEPGKKRLETRLKALQVGRSQISGSTSIRRLEAGYRFTLEDHDIERFNQDYLIIELKHSGTSPQALEEEGGLDDGNYQAIFTAIPADQAYSSPTITPRPNIKGVQTAMVVGLKGEEIYTDDQGRVKVQFHWDRNGQNDEWSSCWVRVSQAWAGAGWGAVHIPRIGQEVIVSFEEGNPDRPLITGRTYHGKNKHPFSLPEGKALSGIKSSSTMGNKGSNELIFDDSRENERVTLHAEHNLSVTAEANEDRNIGVSRNTSIGKDENITIKQHRTVHITEGQETITLHKGDHTANLLKGHATLNVETGNRNVHVPKGAYQLEAVDIKLNATNSIEIVCGESSIKMDAGGNITINGTNLQSLASAINDIKGSIVKINS